jgi:hypothetical protein
VAGKNNEVLIRPQSHRLKSGQKEYGKRKQANYSLQVLATLQGEAKPMAEFIGGYRVIVNN